jgi:Na+/H+ antiporter NhaD/arsenite permease-like protein
MVGGLAYTLAALAVALGLVRPTSAWASAAIGPMTLAVVALLAHVPFFWLLFASTALFVASAAAAMERVARRSARIAWGIVLLLFWLGSGLVGHYFVLLYDLPAKLPPFRDLWPYF